MNRARPRAVRPFPSEANLATRLLVLACLASSAAHAQSWTALGPEGGEVTALAVDPRQPDRVFAGTHGGGVFRSDDGGATWRPASTGLSADDIHALAHAPGATSLLYAATGTGLFRTTDEGASWNEVPTGLSGPAKSLVALAIDPGAPSTLYVASDVGEVGGSATLLKSTDAGANWASLTLPVLDTTVSALAVASGAVFAGTTCCGGGVFKSVDGGNTWTEANVGLGSKLVDALAIERSTPTTVYAATALGLFKSVNSGGQWNAVAGGLPASRTGPIVWSAASPATLYAAIDSRVYRSDDRAATWTAASNGLPAQAVASLAADPSRPGRLYAGTRGFGVYASTDSGAAWSAATSGFVATWIRSVAVEPGAGGQLWAGTFASGSLRSADRGATWAKAALPGTVDALVFDPAVPSTLYAVESGLLMKSADQGATWAAKTNGLPDAGVDELVIAPSAPATLYAGRCGAGVFKTGDGAETWSATGAAASARCVQHLAVDPLDSDVIFASAGGGWANDAVLASTNGGQAWSVATTGLPGGALPGPLAIDPGTPRQVYLGLSGGPGGLYGSTDDGANWSPLMPFAGQVRAVRVDVAAHLVYVASSKGVYKSADRGASWTPLTGDLQVFDVTAMAVGQGPDELYLGTFASGLLALRGPELSPDGGEAADGGDFGSARGSCGCASGAGVPGLLLGLWIAAGGHLAGRARRRRGGPRLQDRALRSGAVAGKVK